MLCGEPFSFCISLIFKHKKHCLYLFSLQVGLHTPIATNNKNIRAYPSSSIDQESGIYQQQKIV
jgi:hypothetical protein